MGLSAAGADRPDRSGRLDGAQGTGRMTALPEGMRRGDRDGRGSGRPEPVLHLLVVEDDVAIRAACLEIASSMSFVTTGASDLRQAETILESQAIDVLLLNMKVPGGNGLDLLEKVKKLQPDTVVVAMTSSATVANAVEAMRVGATDYLTKPFALEELTVILEEAGGKRQYDLESRRLRERLRNQRGVGNLIGHSPEMEKLYRILSKVAHTTHPVLIAGEKGTGKELVAKTIHSTGLNAQRPFTPVDCESLAPELIENELFGFVKGSIPGANRNKDGLLAASDGGTVFLDEVGELALEVQSKLVRALQDREVWQIGATAPMPITARVLASSSRNLPAMVESGRFRRDLYFRLNVVNLKIPSLRERREDIPLLAMHALAREQREKPKDKSIPKAFSDDALRLMMEFDWPGNVTQLEWAVSRVCAECSGPVANLGDLPSPLKEFWLQGRSRRRNEIGEEEELIPERIPSMAEREKLAILETIHQLHGDKLQAAKLLGIGKTTLYRKLKEYGLTEGSEPEGD